MGLTAFIYLANVRYMPTEIAPFRVAVAYWNLATLGLIVVLSGSDASARPGRRVEEGASCPHVTAGDASTGICRSVISRRGLCSRAERGEEGGITSLCFSPRRHGACRGLALTLFSQLFGESFQIVEAALPGGVHGPRQTARAPGIL